MQNTGLRIVNSDRVLVVSFRRDSDTVGCVSIGFWECPPVAHCFALDSCEHETADRLVSWSPLLSLQSMALNSFVGKANPIELEIHSTMNIHPRFYLRWLFETFSAFVYRLTLSHRAQSNNKQDAEPALDADLFRLASHYSWPMLEEVIFSGHNIGSSWIKPGTTIKGKVAIQSSMFVWIRALHIEESLQTATILGTRFLDELRTACPVLSELHFTTRGMVYSEILNEMKDPSSIAAFGPRLTKVTLPGHIWHWTRLPDQWIDDLYERCSNLEWVDFQIPCNPHHDMLEREDAEISALEEKVCTRRYKTVCLVTILAVIRAHATCAGSVLPLIGSVLSLMESKPMRRYHGRMIQANIPASTFEQHLVHANRFARERFAELVDRMNQLGEERSKQLCFKTGGAKRSRG